MKPKSGLIFSIFRMSIGPMSIGRVLVALLWLGAALSISQAADQGLVQIGHFGGSADSVQYGALAVLGHYAYVGEGAGLTVLDVTNTYTPKVVRHIPLAGWPGAIRITNGLAYVAAGAAGLLIYDLADPTSPTLRGDYQTTGSVVSVAVDGGRAAITSVNPQGGGSGEMQILDVSNPAAPRHLGTYDPYSAYGPDHYPQYPLNIKDVALAGTRVFLSIDYDKTHIIDLADPAAPRFNGRLQTPGWFTWLTVAEKKLFAIGLVAGDMVVPSESVSILDLTDTGTLRLLGFTQRVAGQESDWPHIGSLAVADGKLFFTVSNQLRVMDVSVPAAPRLLARTDMGGYTGFYSGLPNSVAADGGRIYMTNADGLHILTLGDWEKGRVLRSMDALDTAKDLTIFQNMAFIREEKDLKVFRLDDPTTLPKRAALPLDAGDLVAITSNPQDYGAQVFQITGGELKVYDMYWGLNYSHTVAWKPGGLARDAAAQRIGDVTWLGVVCEDAALTSGTLFVFGRSSYNPQMDGTLTLPHRLERVTLAGDRALLGWQDGSAGPAACGLTLIDLGDPAKPNKMGEMPFTGVIQDLVWQAPFAYVLIKDQGLRIVDFTDPAIPKLRGTYNVPANAPALRIRLNGPEVWLACGNTSGANLIKLDVSDPDHPKNVRSLPLDHPASAMDLALDDGRLYVVSAGTEAGNPAASRFEIMDGPLRELTQVGPYNAFNTVTGVVARNWRVMITGESSYYDYPIGLMDMSRPSMLACYATVRQPERVTDLELGYATVESGQGVLMFGRDKLIPDSLIMTGALPGSARYLATGGKWLFTASDEAIRVYAADTPGSPTLLSSQSGLPKTVGMAAEGDLLAIITGRTDAGAKPRLKLYTVNAAGQPVARGELADWEIGAYLRGISMDGGVVGVVYDTYRDNSTYKALRLIDVHNPDAPSPLSEVPVGIYYPTGVSLAGGLGLVTGNEVSLYGLANPARPVLLARWSLGETVSGTIDAAQDGNYIYLAAGQQGLYVYKYTGPIPTETPVHDWALYE